MFHDNTRKVSRLYTDPVCILADQLRRRRSKQGNKPYYWHSLDVAERYLRIFPERRKWIEKGIEKMLLERAQKLAGRYQI